MEVDLVLKVKDMSAVASTILRSQNLGFESRHPANIVKHQQTAAAAATTASAAAAAAAKN